MYIDLELNIAAALNLAIDLNASETSASALVYSSTRFNIEFENEITSSQIQPQDAMIVAMPSLTRAAKRKIKCKHISM